MVGWIEKTFPYLQLAVAGCAGIWVALAAALYLNAGRKTAIANLYNWSSVVAALYWWELSFIITYRTLGMFWLVAGLLLFGVGIGPLAYIGEAIRSQWLEIPQLVIALVLVIVPRLFAAWLTTKDPL